MAFHVNCVQLIMAGEEACPYCEDLYSSLEMDRGREWDDNEQLRLYVQD